jgi:ribonucleoside-diphosphate reductase beta chain
MTIDKSFLNLENTKTSAGKNPLFFGEQLGVFDAFNNPYPELSTLDEKQRSLFWHSSEFSLVQSAADMKVADPKIVELMVRNLSFQMAADSLASGSIQELFFPALTNHQAKKLISYHGDSEAVHEESYALIVAQCFKDPNDMYKRITNDVNILKRLKPIGNAFKQYKQIVLDNTESTLTEKRKATIKLLVSFVALEGIMFCNSFMATFALADSTGMFNGIAKRVGLIHNDEWGCHLENMMAFLNIIIKKEKWPEWKEMLPEVKEILDTAVRSEESWSDSLFDGCGSVVGFNSDVLKNYGYFLSGKIYKRLGVQFDFPKINSSPKWLENYINPNLVQSAPQEVQLGNYLTGAISNDVEDDTTFEFDL